MTESAWVCSSCGHTEGREREVLCWRCGGEMQYRGPTTTPLTKDERDRDLADMRRYQREAEARLARVVDLCEGWGHALGCDRRIPSATNAECTCGLSKALAAAKGER
jgi:hypothetical protein